MLQTPAAGLQNQKLRAKPNLQMMMTKVRSLKLGYDCLNIIVDLYCTS